MASYARYTEQQKQRMRDLYAKIGTYNGVAREMGCAMHTVRYVIDPDYRARRRIENRDYQRKISADHVTVRHRLEPRIDYNPLYDPRLDGSPVYVDRTAELLGDPPVGRRQMIAAHVPDREYANRSSDFADLPDDDEEEEE